MELSQVAPDRHRCFAKNLGIFAAAFGLSVALLTLLAQRPAAFPQLDSFSDKLHAFAAERHVIDVIFVGSSRVQRGVVPPVFDAEMAARGLPVRSFNLGVAGMTGHEANAFVRRILAMGPARLRVVVVEAGAWDPRLPPRNRFKLRAILWHDTTETAAVLRSTLKLAAPVGERADLAATHLAHFAARYLALGRGGDIVRSWLASPKIDPAMARWRGFEPYAESAYRLHPWRRRFLQNLEEYRADVARLVREEPWMRAGAEMDSTVPLVVHVVPPVPRPTPELERLHADGAIPHLLRFNRPAVYPELFAVEHRFDREHLTQDGAEIWSRRLAEEMARRLATESGPWLAALRGDTF